MSLVTSALVVLGAIVLGNILYKWRSEPARVWADFSQALYAFGGILIFAVIAFGFDGIGLYVAGALIVFYVWIFRTKASDVRNASWRAVLHGGGK